MLPRKYSTKNAAALEALLVLSALWQGSPLHAQGAHAEDLYRAVVPSVVTLRIQKPDGTELVGSAFLSVQDGVAVTAWHLVAGAIAVTARFPSGDECAVSGVVDWDQEKDIALIRIDATGKPLLPLATQDPAVGCRAYVIGAPRGYEFTITDGLISQIFLENTIRYYQFTCPASPGNSGGPLLAEGGEVLGVVSWQRRDAQNLSFAVPASYVAKLNPALATQGWDTLLAAIPQVKSLKDGVSPRQRLADALELTLDAECAILGLVDALSRPVSVQVTKFPPLRKERVWKLFTPAYVHTIDQQIEASVQALNLLHLEGPERQLRSNLVQALSKCQEGLRGLVQLVRLVQEQQGWTPRARDAIPEVMAMLPKPFEINAQILAPDARPAAVMDLLSEDSRVRLGVLQHPDWLVLGAGSFCREPLNLVWLSEKGLAHRIGLRRDDIVIDVAGVKPGTLLELTATLIRNQGRTVDAVVRRDKQDKKIRLQLPKDIRDRAVKRPE